MQHETQRVIALLNRKQVDFLDKIGKDALFSSGVKLSRNKIISCLIDLSIELGIDGNCISSTQDLKKLIRDKILCPQMPTPEDVLKLKGIKIDDSIKEKL